MTPFPAAVSKRVFYYSGGELRNAALSGTVWHNSVADSNMCSVCMNVQHVKLWVSYAECAERRGVSQECSRVCFCLFV